MDQPAKKVITPEIIQEQSEIPVKPLPKLSELPERQQAYALLRKEGLTNKEASKALNYTEGTGKVLSSKLTNLIKDDSKLVSLARRNLKRLAQGKKYGEIETIKDSTSLSAITAIIDRAEPIVRHIKTESISFNVNYDINDLD